MTEPGGKVAIVTGASRGLGRAVAAELARRGMAVVLGARGGEDCAGAAAEITAAGGQALGQACDVTDYAEVERLAATARARFGGLHVVINNAAVIEPIAPLASSDPALWARSISVNLTGVYNGMRACLPHFIAQGSGVAVNLTTSAARIPFAGWSAYCAAKAGIAMLTAVAQKEVGAAGIRVHDLAPGPMDTDMQATIHATGLNIAPAGLHGVEGPARLAAWLCTDEAADLAGREANFMDTDLRRRAGI